MADDKRLASISRPKGKNNKTEIVTENEVENEVIYRDFDEEETVGCFSSCLASCCQWFSKKGVFRKNTLKLAHRLKKRRSMKSFDEDEVVPEDKNDINATTIAVLAGR